jgi:hypothetical protein
MPLLQVFESRVQDFLNTAQFCTPDILKRSLQLRNAATEKGRHKAIEQDIKQYRDTDRKIKLLVRHTQRLTLALGGDWHTPEVHSD